MKTPEEEAQEIFDKILKEIKEYPAEIYPDDIEFQTAKTISLIQVDGIIEHRREDYNDPDLTSDQSESIDLLMNRLESVRQAIEKM